MTDKEKEIVRALGAAQMESKECAMHDDMQRCQGIYWRKPRSH